MKWISVKDEPIPMGLVIVTDGKNLGYCQDIRWYECVDPEDWKSGYISGIPDSNSHAMEGKDITHWMSLDDIPRPIRIISDPGAHFIFNRRPTENDGPNIKIGESWYVSTLDEFWVLYDIVDGKAIWYLAQRVKE